MKSLKLLVLLGMAALFYLPHVSHALPAGSYLASCAHCKVRHNKLKCICSKRNMRPQVSVLAHVDRCRSVENNNGRLVCNEHKRYPLPFGSYQKTCINCHFNGYKLSCLCQNNHGHFDKRTSLPKVSKCRQGIENINGKLRCKRYRTRALPPGSYRKTCYSCRYHGKRLACQCERRDKRLVSTVLRRPYRCLTIKNINGQLACIR